MAGFRPSINTQEICYCLYCGYAMLYIYDQKIRKHCHTCLLDISQEADEILLRDEKK